MIRIFRAFSTEITFVLKNIRSHGRGLCTDRLLGESAKAVGFQSGQLNSFHCTHRLAHTILHRFTRAAHPIHKVHAKYDPRSLSPVVERCLTVQRVFLC